MSGIIGDRMLRRWARFNTVGALGFSLQIAAVYLFAEVCKIQPLVGGAMAVEIAVLHNFAWHYFLTWRDRPLGKWHGFFSRLLVFNLTNGLVSLSANLRFASVFMQRPGSSLVLANILAIAIAAVVNFVLSDKIVFRARGHRIDSATFAKMRQGSLKPAHTGPALRSGSAV